MFRSLTEFVSPQDETGQIVLAIHSAFIESGYLPVSPPSNQPVLFRSPDGSVSVQLLPSGALSSPSTVYDFTYTPGPTKLRILPVEREIVAHVSFPGSSVQTISFPLTAKPEDVIDSLKQTMLTQQPAPISHIADPTQQPSSIRPRLPRLPRDPLGFLPGHTPEGGDQVGPHNPIFGEPRYDPLGPGCVGEPDFDHQVPGLWGQRPRGKGPFGF